MHYFTDIEEIAHDNDIGIMDTEFESVDGVCMNGSKGYLVVVDSRLSPYHRRWTIAHELGHIADQTVNSRHSHIAESRADRLAIDILIPDHILGQAIDDYGNDCDFLPQLFGVSHETMEKKHKKMFS